MKRCISAAVAGFMFTAAISAVLALAQAPLNEPTKEEISQAYRSKSGEVGTFIPGARWGRWCIKNIRGWKLPFKRISEERSPGVPNAQVRGRRQEERLVCGVEDYGHDDIPTTEPADVTDSHC